MSVSLPEFSTELALRQMVMGKLVNALPQSGSTLFIGFPTHPLKRILYDQRPDLEQEFRISEGFLEDRPRLCAALTECAGRNALVGTEDGEIFVTIGVPLARTIVSSVESRRRIVSLETFTKHLRDLRLLCLDATPAHASLLRSAMPELRETGCVVWCELTKEQQGKRLEGLVKSAKGFSAFILDADGRIRTIKTKGTTQARTLILLPQSHYRPAGLSRAVLAKNTVDAFNALRWPLFVVHDHTSQRLTEILSQLDDFPKCRVMQDKFFLAAVSQVLGEDADLVKTQSGSHLFVLKGQRSLTLQFRVPFPGKYRLGVVFQSMPNADMDMSLGMQRTTGVVDKQNHQIRLTSPFCVADNTETLALQLRHNSGDMESESLIKGIELTCHDPFFAHDLVPNGQDYSHV